MTAPTLSSRPKEAKLLRNNRSQAVRIPVEFELPGDRVLIHREGSKLIIEPVLRPTNILELLAEWRQEAAAGARGSVPGHRRCPGSARGPAVSGYLLDTNIISDLIRNPFGAAAQRIAQLGAKGICTSIGGRGSCAMVAPRRIAPSAYQGAQALLETIPVLALDLPADGDYGRIRAELKRRGSPSAATTC